MSSLSPIGGTFLSRFHILYVRFQLGNGISILPLSITDRALLLYYKGKAMNEYCWLKIVWIFLTAAAILASGWFQNGICIATEQKLKEEIVDDGKDQRSAYIDGIVPEKYIIAMGRFDHNWRYNEKYVEE
jgi:hypothetical protein